MKCFNYLIWLLFFNPCIAVVFSFIFAMLWGETHSFGNPDTDMSVFDGYEWIIVTPMFSYMIGCAVCVWGKKISDNFKISIFYVGVSAFIICFLMYFGICYWLG